MIDSNILKKRFSKVIENTETMEMVGRITKVIGLVIESEGPKSSIGEICLLKDRNGKVMSKSEVVGFKDNRILSMVLGDLNEISPGMKIYATGEMLKIKVGDILLSRVLDGLGNPLDDKGPIETDKKRSVIAQPPNPLLRKKITEPIATGIKAIDGMLTFGKGQRVGIFSGSGVGKSTLLGMIARNTSADINVIALIGERGREVREFLENDLGEAGLKRSIVVIATSDAPSLVRVKAALVATTIAEYFRDRDLDVMLMMDSATRLGDGSTRSGLDHW
jgi:flagellum-specific ATP synthase